MKSSFLLPAICLFIYSKTFTQGKVGINTTSPQAMLHVKDSSVLFTGASIITVPQGNPPISGAGIRMMWYPDKAAFRAGYVDGTQWDKNNIGNYSFSGGHGTIASGGFSTAFGLSALAAGTGSVSLGTGTDALGNNSVALGVSATTTGSNSVAIGTTTRSVAQYSTAMGAFTVSHAYNCFTVGRYNDTVSTGFLPTFQWQESDPLFIIGNGANNNSRSNAMTVLKNGNTGINMSNPQRPLHILMGSTLTGITPNTAAVIVAERDGNDAYLNILTDANQASGIVFGNQNNSTDGGIYYNTGGSTYDLRFRTDNNVTHMTIDAVGNIGIGTTTPQRKLHVQASSAGTTITPNADAVFVAERSGANAFISLLTNSDMGSGITFGNQNHSIDGGIYYNLGGNDYNLRFRTNGNVTRMVVDSVGRLGIGTTSPDERLDVNGNIKLSGEINRSATGGLNLLPICIGLIASNGTIMGGSGNFTCVKEMTGAYAITISNETYTYQNYITTATAVFAGSNIVNTFSENGKLYLYTFNEDGDLEDVYFSFIVYKL